MKSFVALAILLVPAVAGCQQLPPLNVFLERPDAYARQYQSTLPSLACDEEIASQALNKRGKITREVKVQSTLREMRNSDPYEPFLEKRQIKTVNGRPPKASFRTSQLPYFVEGGFAGLVGFKRWQQRECFDYSFNPGESSETVRLEMTIKPRPRSPSCVALPDDFHRIVIADAGTGRVLHTERTISPEEAEMRTEVYFGGIDYAPRQLGDHTFWLPLRFWSHDAGNTGQMFATYSNCHRYIGELNIVPGESLPGSGNRPH